MLLFVNERYNNIQGKESHGRSNKILEMTYYKTICNNVKKSIGKWDIPKIERYNKISVKPPIMNVPLKYLFYKINSKVIEVCMDTNEPVILEELLYKETETYITRTELVMHTRVIRTTSADESMDHG